MPREISVKRSAVVGSSISVDLAIASITDPPNAASAADTANIGAAGVITINTGQSVRNLNNAGQITIDAFGLNLVGGGNTVNTGKS